MPLLGEAVASDNLAGKQYLRPEFARRIKEGDATMQGLAGAHDNYRQFYERMKAAAVQKDPAHTEEGHFLEMRDLAFRTAKNAADRSDRAIEAAKQEVTLARLDLQTKLGLVEDSRAAEVRGYLRTMTDEERNKLLQEAVSAGDAKTVAAVVEAPGFLSGISTEQAQALRMQYETKHGGDIPARIRDLEKAISINKQTASDALTFLDRLLPHDKFMEIQSRQAAAKAVRDGLAGVA